MGRTEFFLPVRRFHVLVTYHPFDGLTPVEQHLLLAVAAGVGTLEKLAAHLGLPRRLLLDACIDLLSIGAIEIGAQAQMLASARTLAAIGDWRSPNAGWENSFATRAAPPAEAVALMQETVSGCVFRALPRRAEFRERLHRLPQDPELPPIDDIPRSELLAAVLARPLGPQPSVDAGADRNRRARVGDVRLVRAEVLAGGTQPSAEVTLNVIVVDMVAAKRADDSARFAILGPDNVPSFVRKRVATGLAGLWERGIARGPGQVLDLLAYDDDMESVAAEGRLELPDEPLRRLRDALASLGSAPSDEAHERLLGLELDAIAAVTRAIGAGTKAQLVEGARAHHEALHEALRCAKQQVVLAGPWVERFGQQDLRQAVIRAVERNVTVVLLWGIGREETLPASVVSLRDELSLRQPPGAFRVADRAAISHAKFMVCDHDWAIVSSCNFLNSSPERTTEELGVRLTSPPPFVESEPGDARTAPSHPISELLRWARAVVPDYRVAHFIGDSPVLFGLGSGARRLRAPPPILPPPPTATIAMETALWTQAWSRRVQELTEELTRTGTYAFSVDSAAHREVLFDGIATAHRRILIESPTVTTVATSEPFVRSLREARTRGVDVAIRFDKRDPAGPEGDARWDELAPAGVRMLKADTHAKLLVIDDCILVGSFNFLSFEGRRRRELGVQVVDRALADRAASRFR